MTRFRVCRFTPPRHTCAHSHPASPPPPRAQLHVSATLFDEATGSFFGSTARTQPAVLVQPLDSRLVGVALKELVFFHTCAADERVSLVVEVVLSERRGGVVQQSFAIAWAVRPSLLDLISLSVSSRVPSALSFSRLDPGTH